MPPVKDEKQTSTSLNTSAQIQQIFADVQSQLPSVNFDTDDPNGDQENAESLEASLNDNTDALIESLSNHRIHSFLPSHSMIETPQQPPSVELQMRLSPNLFDSNESPPKSSVLSMDLFNSIDFDKLPSMVGQSNSTRTFHRPRPMPTSLHSSSNEEPIKSKNRDDRQILERLAQQANRFDSHPRSPLTVDEQSPFRNLQSALFAASNEHYNRHGRRIAATEGERKTIFIDLRHSQTGKQESNIVEQPTSPRLSKPMEDQPLSSDSESDDNDGMLWFERRKQQRQQQSTAKKQ